MPPGLFNVLLHIFALLSGKKTRRTILALPFFLAYLNTRQAFQTVRTRKFLELAGVEVPSPQSYLEQVIERYLDQKHGD